MQTGIVRSCLPEKFQAANIAGFGDMAYNVLPKWPFMSVMQSHFENKSFKVQTIHVSYLNIDTELFASYKDTYLLHFAN